jgi:thioredoxin reductase (NADPH)
VPEPTNGIIRMYGANWCPDCRRAKQFFGEQRIHYEYIDVEQQPEAISEVERINNGMRSIPTIIFPDGSILVEPSNTQLAAKLGLNLEASQQFYDVIIVGSGPAGLTAAIYTSREGLSTLVLEKGGVGGQVGLTRHMDNYPGFDQGISGADLADRLRKQAERFGVEIVQAQQVTGLDYDGAYRLARMSDGKEYCGGAILLATGSHYRRSACPVNPSSSESISIFGDVRRAVLPGKRGVCHRRRQQRLSGIAAHLPVCQPCHDPGI